MRPLPIRAGRRDDDDLGRAVGPRTAQALELLRIQQAGAERRASLPPPEPPKPDRPGGLAGLVSGFGRLIKGVPQGVIGLGKQAGQSVIGVPRLLIDLARMRVPEQVDTEGDRGWADNVMSGVREYFPLLAEIAESGERTVHRVTNPTEYARAWREGTLAEALVEDVSNVALAGGVAARALGVTSRTVPLSISEAAAVTGTRPARAAGAMTAEDLSGRLAATVRNAGARDPAASLTRVVPTVEMTEVTLPGRGLAGILERAGRQQLAERVGRAGQITRSVATLGERAGGAPALPYELAARGAGRVVQAATGRRPGELVRAGVERVGARGGLLFGFTDEGRRFAEVKANIERSNVDAQRFAINPARLAAERGLSQSEARAALLSIDQAMRPIAQMVRQLGDQVDDAAIDEIIRRAFEGVEPGLRPTPDDIRTLIAYEDRTLPAGTLAAMDAVAQAQREISQQRTEVMLDPTDSETGLSPEQVETPEMLELVREGEPVQVPRPLSFVQRREQRLLERRRDRVQREWERASQTAARLARIADATEAVNAELPPPPRADLAYRQGRRDQRAAAANSLARRLHRQAQSELRRALDEYVRLVEGGPADVVDRLAAEVDRLTERAVELEAMVREAERRAAATAALSRVSGEVEPGAPRVFEGMAEGRPVVGRRPAEDAQSRPQVDPSSAAGVTAIRRRAREIGQRQADEIFGEIEQMTEGDRPSLPPKRSEAGGEYDFWWELPRSTQLLLQREGWFRGRRGRHVVGPDEIAENIARRRGGDPRDVNGMMRLYVETVLRYHEAKRGRTPEIVAQIADEFGLTPDAVETALRGTDVEYRQRLADTADQALDELRADYEALPAEERELFSTLLDQMLGDESMTPGDFLELVDQFIAGAGDPDGPLAAISDMVDPRELARFVRTGERGPTLRAVSTRRSPAQQRQVGRREAEVEAARGRLAEVYRQQRETRRVLTAAERQFERDQQRARRAVVRAGERVEATTPALEFVDERPTFDRTWRRFGDARYSRGERALIRQGRLRAQADAAQRRVARLRRSLDRYNDRIGDVPIELSRRFQERLVADVNDPTIRRVQRLVASVYDMLPDERNAVSALLEDIESIIARDREGRLLANTPYRVRDLVNDAVWLPADIRSRLDKVFEDYEKRRARHLDTVFDRYAEAAPARYRRLMQNGRRQVKALLELAEEWNRREPGSGDVLIVAAEDTATTLAEFLEQGIDPTHLIGGDEIEATFTAGGGRRLTRRRLRAEHVARTGLRPLDPAAVARLEADQVAKIIHNRTSRYVIDQFGRRADEVPAIAEAMRDYEATNGEPMPPKVLARTAKEAGWVPAEGTEVHPQTILISEAINRQLQASRLDQSWLWGKLRDWNRKWKAWVLPLSPKWMAGNVVGNAIQAAAHAGVGPAALARRMRDIVRQEGGLAALWDQSGLPDWAPAELASHGLSYNEWRIMYGQGPERQARTPVGKAIALSYRLNEFVDNLTRSAVMLEELGDGVPSDKAMQVALRSLGDFTRMSSFERRVVREILPFYTWLRHQTVATLRLPITSPTRAAWMLQLAHLYTDPDMRVSLLEFLGSLIPIGGNRYLDAGSISPFATLPEIPFAPTAIGRHVSPFIKVPLAIATGVDLNRGGQQLTRPAGTMRRGNYGQEEPTPPLYRLVSDPVRGLGEIGYVATQQAPAPIRSIRDLILGDEARYATGYTVTQRGRPLRNERLTPISVILRGLGLPAPVTIDIEEMERRAREQERRQRG